MEWRDNLELNDIDENYRDIAEEIGVENFIKIVKKFGGTSLYIPKLKTVYNDIIRRLVLKEYNGHNKKKLAVKYDVSERTIQTIISENYNQEQLKLFWKIRSKLLV